MADHTFLNKRFSAWALSDEASRCIAIETAVAPASTTTDPHQTGPVTVSDTQAAWIGAARQNGFKGAAA